jgi:hypothetical protein
MLASDSTGVSRKLSRVRVARAGLGLEFGALTGQRGDVGLMGRLFQSSRPFARGQGQSLETQGTASPGGRGAAEWGRAGVAAGRRTSAGPRPGRRASGSPAPEDASGWSRAECGRGGRRQQVRSRSRSARGPLRLGWDWDPHGACSRGVGRRGRCLGHSSGRSEWVKHPRAEEALHPPRRPLVSTKSL